MLVTAAIWTPVGDPASAHVAWFRDDPAIDVLATLVAMGPVAALGGPLLGVAVARWAPFRGSALIGVVTLVFLTALPSESRQSLAAALGLADPRRRAREQ